MHVIFFSQDSGKHWVYSANTHRCMGWKQNQFSLYIYLFIYSLSSTVSKNALKHFYLTLFAPLKMFTWKCAVRRADHESGWCINILTRQNAFLGQQTKWPPKLNCWINFVEQNIWWKFTCEYSYRKCAARHVDHESRWCIQFWPAESVFWLKTKRKRATIFALKP